MKLVGNTLSMSIIVMLVESIYYSMLDFNLGRVSFRSSELVIKLKTPFPSISQVLNKSEIEFENYPCISNVFFAMITT